LKRGDIQRLAAMEDLHTLVGVTGGSAIGDHDVSIATCFPRLTW
jgi:hypothetical protein